MAEFRYQGIGLSGRIIQGIISARNKREAMKRAEDIAKSRRFRLQNINRKATFTYKVRKGRESVVTGQQKAFTADEVRRALEKMGYTVMSIQKKLFDIKLKPPSKDVVMFIRLSADLLREKLPYDEILNLLSNDMDNKSLKQTLKEINQDLKDGKDGKRFSANKRMLLENSPPTCSAWLPSPVTWWRFTNLPRNFWKEMKNSRRT